VQVDGQAPTEARANHKSREKDERTLPRRFCCGTTSAENSAVRNLLTSWHTLRCVATGPNDAVRHYRYPSRPPRWHDLCRALRMGLGRRCDHASMGWLMMGLGIFFTVVVGCGLVFYSSRAGYDEVPQIEYNEESKQEPRTRRQKKRRPRSHPKHPASP
jgi:hypothetical protein